MAGISLFLSRNYEQISDFDFKSQKKWNERLINGLKMHTKNVKRSLWIHDSNWGPVAHTESMQTTTLQSLTDKPACLLQTDYGS